MKSFVGRLSFVDRRHRLIVLAPDSMA